MLHKEGKGNIYGMIVPERASVIVIEIQTGAILNSYLMLVPGFRQSGMYTSLRSVFVKSSILAHHPVQIGMLPGPAML
jgi:hypothetical protein